MFDVCLMLDDTVGLLSPSLLSSTRQRQLHPQVASPRAAVRVRHARKDRGRAPQVHRAAPERDSRGEVQGPARRARQQRRPASWSKDNSSTYSVREPTVLCGSFPGSLCVLVI